MNMKKITKIIAVSAIIILPAFTFAAVGAPSTDDAGNAGSSGSTGSNTPSVDDGGNAGNTGTGGTFTPSTDDQGNASVKSSSNSSKKSSGSSSSSKSKPSINTVARTCPLITEYLNLGGENNSNEVVKLQAFLKLYEKADLEINGKFDQKTLDAVKAFQNKYFTETMSPWGSDQASGKVFITTVKKINEIYCGNPRALTAEELAIIADYKNSLAFGSSDTIVSGGNVVENDIDLTDSDENGDNDQTASASGSKAGKFFRGIVKFLINR